MSSNAFGHDTPLTFDRIHLNASASAEVANDTLVAELYALQEGQDPTELTNEVNDAVAWALEVATKSKAIKVQTLGYQTQPIYQNQRLTGWRVRQSLRLESREPEQLAKLLGALQERLRLQSVSYAISPARQREAEDALMIEALAAFRARAELVRGELGAAAYRLVQLSVDGGMPAPMPRAAMAMEMRAAAAPPALEPGTRDVNVTVSGIIELERR
jgi:predicted secreted protein